MWLIWWSPTWESLQGSLLGLLSSRYIACCSFRCELDCTILLHLFLCSKFSRCTQKHIDLDFLLKLNLYVKVRSSWFLKNTGRESSCVLFDTYIHIYFLAFFCFCCHIASVTSPFFFLIGTYKTLLHSTTSCQRLHRVTLTELVHCICTAPQYCFCRDRDKSWQSLFSPNRLSEKV